MKIAGHKNDGAWFRFNKWLILGYNNDHQPDEVITALSTAILGLPTIDAYFDVMSGIAADAGISSSFPSDKAALVAAWMTHGIPRQVWMGRLSWTEYDKTTIQGKTRYIGRGQSEAHYFGVDLRRTCRHAMFSIRELSDVGNFLHNNPGGYPDAQKEGISGLDKPAVAKYKRRSPQA